MGVTTGTLIHSMPRNGLKTMADLPNGPVLPNARPPVRLEVRIGSELQLDPKARIAIFAASNPVLLDTYQVAIPVAMLKALVGQLIATEAENEAKARSSGVAQPTLHILRPT